MFAYLFYCYLARIWENSCHTFSFIKLLHSIIQDYLSFEVLRYIYKTGQQMNNFLVNECEVTPRMERSGVNVPATIATKISGHSWDNLSLFSLDVYVRRGQGNHTTK